MLALSVSISTSGSPRFTSPPSSTSHLSTVPSSMESERRGIVTSLAMLLLEVAGGGERRGHHVLLVWERRLLEWLGVRHGAVRAGPPLHGRVEPVEGLLLDQRREVRAHAAVRPALLDDHGPVRLLDRLEDRVQIERPQRAWVDHLGAEVVLVLEH